MEVMVVMVVMVAHGRLYSQSSVKILAIKLPPMLSLKYNRCLLRNINSTNMFDVLQIMRLFIISFLSAYNFNNN